LEKTEQKLKKICVVLEQKKEDKKKRLKINQRSIKTQNKKDKNKED
jgi:predicted ATPase